MKYHWRRFVTGQKRQLTPNLPGFDPVTAPNFKSISREHLYGWRHEGGLASALSSRAGHHPRSLGWIPFKASAIRYRSGQVHFMSQALSLWDSFGLSQYEPDSGNLCEDAQGRWHLNVTVKVPRPAPETCQNAQVIHSSGSLQNE